MGLNTGGILEVVTRGGVNHSLARIAFLPLVLLLLAGFLSPNSLAGWPSKERPLGPGITREFFRDTGGCPRGVARGS